ncbi:GNAT family N-acetyltransferase [Lysinibacillus sp. fkY74-1]|uniref:Acetyltransferase n=3 Tax=Lysinibacillus TaxID=400634 RepID=W7RLK2_LYSSH|nr:MULTISPECIES: GNAT family N-acetyltransferase [Lysinibacillus]EWH32382.1 acetyltransferase [Lysinibacillus sphaericus CBAM5]MCS1396252.1 GNAT family N-acetyltransferase [Lysinibacillus sp. PB211]MDR0159010.1 GNAT family N-acetyltransferase [Lysinibacillus sphaericus]
MSQSPTEFFIRNFEHGDMPLLGELYQSVTAKDNATFWWVGDEDNWSNVYCAFEDGKMVAKGQVSIINVVPPGRSKENNHSIYINLKTISEREQDITLLDKVYQYLLTRAKQLKVTLPQEYGTILCVGNDSKETANNQFFIQKGYLPLNSLYSMNRDLTEPVVELKLQEEFQFSHWSMETSSEERDYLNIEAEIWPDAPLGLNRLSEYKKNKLWTSMVIRQIDTIVGGLMTWQEEDYGVIEDVFVREPWRKRGIAKFTLTQALKYLKSHKLQKATLMVLTTNKSALSLYESVGFYTDKEEIRYFTKLN